MAFTAGSVELAKATKLANQLSELYQKFGSTNMSGTTAAQIVEDYAQKLGFGITGLTTGTAFPPFGTARPQLGLGVAAALQNPRGETRASGFDIGGFLGATVGIYSHKYVRTGEDYRATTFGGLTLFAPTTVAGTTFRINGPFAAHTNDLIVIGSTSFKISSGFTSGTSTFPAQVTVSGQIESVYPLGTAISIQSIGVTRGTSGVAGTTFETFRGGTVVNGGFTACVFFGGAAGSTGSIS